MMSSARSIVWMPRSVRRYGSWKLTYQPQCSPLSRNESQTACQSPSRCSISDDTSQAASIERPVAPGERLGEPLAPGHAGRDRRGRDRHLADGALRAPEREQVGRVLDHDHGPRRPELALEDVLQNDHLARRPPATVTHRQRTSAPTIAASYGAPPTGSRESAGRHEHARLAVARCQSGAKISVGAASSLVGA